MEYQNGRQEKEIELLKKDQELQKLELSRQQANTTIIIIALIAVVIISIILVNRYRVLNRTRRLVEMERMRNTIARDLHDDIGSTLSSINIISQMALKEANGSSPHFQRIAQHSSSMMESMSDIVWSINPNNDSLEQVISKMKEFTAEILDPLDINYTFSGEENLDAFKLDVSKRKNLFLIFKEAINNSAKYSSATSITIRFKKENNTIQVTITDNGKGFDAISSTTGNGLRNMKERADTIHGKLEVKSSPGAGTEVLLTLPIT
ncbi:MAG: ATP-binding protein [Cyclobacteriaceae bacterium]